MLGFSGWAAYRWINTGLLFFALTLFRDVAAAYFLLVRHPDKSVRQFGMADVLAYVSSAMPFVYFSGGQNPVELVAAFNGLAIIGFALATVALFELGGSFGVSPANRGMVRTGIYKFVRHPMYLGYAIAESGFLLFGPKNLGFFIMSATLYFLRARAESKILPSEISQVDHSNCRL